MVLWVSLLTAVFTIITSRPAVCHGSICQNCDFAHKHIGACHGESFPDGASASC